MTDPNDDSQRIDELRSDIAETRAEMSGTIQEIEQRLSPGSARERLEAGAQQRLAELRRSAADRTATMRTELSRRSDDVPRGAVAGAGAGLAALGTLGTAIRRQRAQRVQARLLQQQRTATGGAAAGALAAVLGLAGALRAHRRRRTVTVRQVMTPEVATVLVTDTLASAAQRMADLDVGSLPVLAASGKLAGMLSDRDIVVKAVARGDDPRVLTAGQVAEAPVVTVGADESVTAALGLMSRHAIRRLPVVDGDTLVGVVAQADLAVHIQEGNVGDLVEDISAAPGDHSPQSASVRR